MSALYNEIDAAACAVLAQVMSDGVIAPGRVEPRSIKDLTAYDIEGFTQVHLFAGGGFWSLAARLAGWRDDEPLFTASCPCQPFSQAGRGSGVDDPRHLWPDVDRLLNGLEHRGKLPPVIVGEQVAGAPGYAWFDRVRSDLAAKGYRARVVDIPACAVDAPHIRQRLYWAAVVDPEGIGRGEGRAEHELRRGWRAAAGADAQGRGGAMGDAFQPGLEGFARHGDRAAGRALEVGSVTAPDGRDMGDCAGQGRNEGPRAAAPTRHGHQSAAAHGSDRLYADADRGGCAGWPQGEIGQSQRGTVAERDLPRRNGSAWSDSIWIACHDGKARRTKPGLRLLVDGIPRRVDLWRIGGNAIVLPLAVEVLAALRESLIAVGIMQETA